MLKRLYRKLFRKASKPVTTGWVEYRGLMRRDEFENYVITGSPDISFATGGPDDFALNLDLDTEKET